MNWNAHYDTTTRTCGLRSFSALTREGPWELPHVAIFHMPILSLNPSLPRPFTQPSTPRAFRTRFYNAAIRDLDHRTLNCIRVSPMCPRGTTERTQLLPGNTGTLLLDGPMIPSCVHFSPMVVATHSLFPMVTFGHPTGSTGHLHNKSYTLPPHTHHVHDHHCH